MMFLFLDKKGVDTRLQGAQSTLLLQEETIRRSERERKTMLDQIAGLERQLLAMENEKKQFVVCLSSLFRKTSI
jgi:septal ring factor EnvC (AmiA/AmiB activator)